ncbi:hypothetical protein V8C44DRAFT_345561 [Trichoderma aethiopicum]
MPARTWLLPCSCAACQASYLYMCEDEETRMFSYSGATSNEQRAALRGCEGVAFLWSLYPPHSPDIYLVLVHNTVGASFSVVLVHSRKRAAGRGGQLHSILCGGERIPQPGMAPAERRVASPSIASD